MGAPGCAFSIELRRDRYSAFCCKIKVDWSALRLLTALHFELAHRETRHDATLQAFHRRGVRRSKPKIRAYFDADIPSSVAERVRTKLRWDVVSAQEQADLRRRDDEFHYKNARKLRRILFTLGKDFLDDRRFPLHQSPGVFVLQASQDDPDDIFHAIHVAAMTLTEAYRRIPGFHLQMKVTMTLDGQRIRYITNDSKVHELLAPH